MTMGEDAAEGAASCASRDAAAGHDHAAVLTRQECTANAGKSAATGDVEAAIAWVSRALELVAVAPSIESDTAPSSTNSTAVLLLRRAEYEMQTKVYDLALRDADAVCAGSTDRKTRAKAVRLQCRALLALDRHDEALRAWKEQFTLDSPVLDELAFRREFGVVAEEDESRYDVALQYLYRRDFGNTISLLNKTLDAAKKGKGKSKNKDPVLYLLRARCRFELQEYEEAVADAERVITLLPTATEAYRWLCSALISLKKNGQASKVCKAGLSVSPNDEALLALRVKLSKSKQRRDVKIAKGINGEVADATQSEDTGMHIPEDRLNEDPTIEAIRSVKRAIKADPLNHELYCEISQLRLSLQQYEQAQTDAAQAITLNKSAPGGYLCSCEALYASRRYQKALRVCEQGILLVDPADDGARRLHEWKIRVEDALVNPPPDEQHEELPKLGKSRIPKAVAARKQERAQRKVDDAQAQRSKCYAKAVELADERDFGNAVFWLNKAEGYDGDRNDSSTAQICSLRARCRFELKQFEHAGRDAERAIVLAPDDPENYRWACLALKIRGHRDRALAMCKSGLEVGPDHKPLLSLLRSLDQGTRSSSK